MGEGHEIYEATMKDIEHAYGMNDDRVHDWLCYFVRALIDTRQWTQVNHGMDKLLSIENDNISDANQEQMNEVFTNYMDAINNEVNNEDDDSFLNKNKAKIQQIMNA